MSWRPRDDNDEFVVVDVCGFVDDAPTVAATVAGAAKRAHSPATSWHSRAITEIPSPSTKSPGRKYCLTASFSRMSPFKTIKVGAVESSSLSPAESAKAPARRNLLASFQIAEPGTRINSQKPEPSYSTPSTERRVKAPRKEKSLGNLCKRFLLTMGELAADAQANDVHLESVAKHMKVEKRRIYDIVNVMEALEAMTKTNKSFYRWCGLAALPQLMNSLQKEAIAAKFPDRIRQVGEAMCNFMDLSASREDTLAGLRRTPSNVSPQPSASDGSFKENLDDSTWSQSATDASADDDTAAATAAGGHCGGKNSLVHLCRRFLMMLLCNPEKRYVSLDVLSTVLIKDPASEDFTPPDRSRCRRLYDIANVLEAMELIRKVPGHFGTKKIPLFEYCGPEPDASPLNAERSMRRFLDRIGLSAMSAGGALRPSMAPPPTATVVDERPMAVPSNYLPMRQTRNYISGVPPPAASSIQYLAEVAAQFMRSRLHPLSVTAPLIEENKKNRPPAPTVIKSELHENSRPTTAVAPTDIDLPKPINPRGSLSSLTSFNGPRGPNAATAITDLLKTVLPQPAVSSGLGADSLSPMVFDYLRGRRSDGGAHFLTALQQTPRPKVTHSVSSILGAAQIENVDPGCWLSTSPKAFKPYSQSHRNNSNKSTTKTPLRQQQNFENR